MIKNLSQLKKALLPGVRLEITAHCHPEHIGRRREVTKANTQGFYSIDPDDPNGRVSLANGGLGSWLDWCSAPFWAFENGECRVYSVKEKTSDKLIMAFRVKEDAA